MQWTTVLYISLMVAVAAAALRRTVSVEQDVTDMNEESGQHGHVA